ncbi:putative transposase, partial [Tremellales sp. Uapishka_1]
MLSATSPDPTLVEELQHVPGVYHDYLDVFSKRNADQLPPHRSYDHHIPLQEGSVPNHGCIYRLSDIELEALRENLDENLAKGFIRPSESPAGSPILFVKKKDGSLRLCVDYRNLNSITIKNRYPLPLISELLDRVRDAKIFSKIDLRGAYNLLRIAEGDEWKTAFRTRYGHFEYLVMPFGLTNAPASFQHLMNDNFRDMLDNFVIVYLDDILIYSKDITEHQLHVRQVLERLRQVGLFAKAEKCEFHKNQVEFLGFVIKSDGIIMDTKKIESVLSWPTPKNVHDIRVFLGFANFYRRFIKNYSSTVTPLTALTVKDQPFAWTQRTQQAFDQIKSSFQTATMLSHFDPQQNIVVETDASDYAIAGVLSQPNHQGILHPVAFFSRKMAPAELNYEIHDKEMLAIIESLREWRHYLEGTLEPITIYTDHQSLQYFMSSKQLNRRQARWLLFLSDYNFKIHYRPGKQAGKPDALTRRSDYHPTFRSSSLSTEANPHNYQQLLKPHHMALATQSTIASDLRQDIVKAQMMDQFAISVEKKEPYTFDVDGALLCDHKLYVPDQDKLRLTLLQQHHDSPLAGHAGRSKTLQLIKRNYWWSGMKNDIHAFVDTCDLCQRTKTRRHKPYGLLKSLPVPPHPWSSISMDFIEQLPPSNEYDAILVVVDRLTKMAIFIPSSTTVTAMDVADHYVTHVFSKHGLPNDIISDRGSEFTSSFWKSLASNLGIQSNFSTAFHPQTDGQTERVNQSLEQYIRLYTNYKQSDWSKWLPLAEFAYNNTPHSTTTISPFMANKGFDPACAFNIPATASNNAEADQYAIDLSQLHQWLRDTITTSVEQSTRHANKERTEPPDYKVGDKVWLNARNVKTIRPAKKLDHKFLGPFEIIKQVSTHAYKLKLPTSMRIHPVFHISLLEPHLDNDIEGRIQQPPPPVEIQGEQEYEVEHILDYKTNKRWREPLRYLVQWKGYGPNHNTWEPPSHLTNAKNLLDKFNTTHGIP